MCMSSESLIHHHFPGFLLPPAHIRSMVYANDFGNVLLKYERLTSRSDSVTHFVSICNVLLACSDNVRRATVSVGAEPFP